MSRLRQAAHREGGGLSAAQRRLLARIAERQAEGWPCFWADGRSSTVVRSLREMGLIEADLDRGNRGYHRVGPTLWACRLTAAGREAAGV